MNCRSAVLFGATLCLWGAALADDSRAPDVPDTSAAAEAGEAAIRIDALLSRLLPVPLLLVGEQHDAPEHQALQRDLVRAIAARGQLAALVMEMAEAGTHTRDLAREASESVVREALHWTSDQGGWPWTTYAPVVMAAVRAGVPVLGGNLPRSDMRAAMVETALDGLLSNGALERQREAIREGHCGLLPDAQITPMTRVQIARDRSMARTAAMATRPGHTVLLVAGNNHVQRDLGVPQHLPPDLAHRVVMALASDGEAPAPTGDESRAGADAVWRSPPRAPRDYCAEMKRSLPR